MFIVAISAGDFLTPHFPINLIADQLDGYVCKINSLIAIKKGACTYASLVTSKLFLKSIGKSLFLI
jgi:hypothetical protein